MVVVGNKEQITLAEENSFFSLPRGRSGFFVFNANTIVATAAAVVSLLGFVYTTWSSNASSGHEAIKGLYATYYDISKTELQIPQALHIFMLPGKVYEDVKSQVAVATSKASPSQLAIFKLDERAMADYLFSVFEANLIDYQSSNQIFDHERRKFEKIVVDYFTQHLLRNPRLLYYWNKDGGGLSAEYQKATRDYYDANVLHDPTHPLAPDEREDAIGPLTGDPSAHHGSE
jgi:hypothetical protein